MKGAIMSAERARQCAETVRDSMEWRHGFRLRGLVASPILGASGNREFFVLLRLK